MAPRVNVNLMREIQQTQRSRALQRGLADPETI